MISNKVRDPCLVATFYTIATIYNFKADILFDFRLLKITMSVWPL